MSDPTLEYAQQLRQWEEENPWKSVALGFVPGIGAAYGGASAAAALRDPEATAIEKTLAIAGMLPGGKLLGKLKPKRDIILHEPQIEKLKEVRKKYPPWKGIDREVVDVAPQGLTGEKRMYIPDPILDMEKVRDAFPIEHYGPGGQTLASPDKYVDMLRDDLEYNNLVRELFPQMDELRFARQAGYKGSHFNRAATDAADPLEESSIAYPQIVIGEEWDMLADDAPHYLRTLGEANVRGRTGHELQHFAQHQAGAPEHWRGTNESKAGSYYNYLRQPGEMEARLNDLMQQYPNSAGKAKLKDLYKYQQEYFDYGQAGNPSIPDEELWIKSRIAGDDLNEVVHTLRRRQDIGR